MAILFNCTHLAQDILLDAHWHCALLESKPVLMAIINVWLQIKCRLKPCHFKASRPECWCSMKGRSTLLGLTKRRWCHKSFLGNSTTGLAIHTPVWFQCSVNLRGKITHSTGSYWCSSLCSCLFVWHSGESTIMWLKGSEGKNIAEQSLALVMRQAGKTVTAMAILCQMRPGFMSASWEERLQ